MNRLATLIALVLVLSIVSAGISSASASTLVTCTVLVATGMVLHKSLAGVLATSAGERMSSFRHFVVCLLQNLFRFALGAVLIAWAVVSSLWFFGS